MNGSLARLIPFVPFWLYLVWGALGVQTFFVISGFLITHLLLKELNASGTISLKHFYFRRALRIFPPFYVYMAVALVVTLAGWAAGDLRAFVVAATYTWNYLGGGSELLEHTWSLSLEEQFYLLWPAALVFLGTRKSSKLARLGDSAFTRVKNCHLLPGARSSRAAERDAAYRASTASCSAASWQSFGATHGLISSSNRWCGDGQQPSAAAFVLVLAPVFLEARFRGSYSLVFGFTLNAICLSLILLYVVRVPGSAVGRLLNTRGAAPPGRDLLQPLSLAANVYRRKQRPVLSLEPACNPRLRGTLLLAGGTALAAAEGTAGVQVAMEDCAPPQPVTMGTTGG